MDLTVAPNNSHLLPATVAILLEEPVVNIDKFNMRRLDGFYLFEGKNGENGNYHPVDKRSVQIAGIETSAFQLDDMRAMEWLYQLVARCGKIDAMYSHENTRNRKDSRIIVSVAFETEVAALRCYQLASNYQVGGVPMLLEMTPRQYTALHSWFTTPEILLGRLHPVDDTGFQIAERFERNLGVIPVDTGIAPVAPLEVIPFGDLPNNRTISIWRELRSEGELQRYPGVKSFSIRQGWFDRKWMVHKELELDKKMRQGSYRSLRTQPVGTSLIQPAVAGPSAQPVAQIGKKLPVKPKPITESRANAWNSSATHQVDQSPEGYGKPVGETENTTIYSGNFIRYKDSNRLRVAKKTLAEKLETPYQWLKEVDFDDAFENRYFDDTRRFLQKTHQDVKKNGNFGWALDNDPSPTGINKLLAQLPLSTLYKAGIIDQLEDSSRPFDQPVDTEETQQGLARRRMELEKKDNLSSNEISWGKLKVHWGVGYTPTEQEPQVLPKASGSSMSCRLPPRQGYWYRDLRNG
ncbi:hypothetical protein I203_100806 [Kwoniella mangroviensis CBS 8507]|uniref:uncharacterized protein n=1 Tax=Kwoniella mangroviensis CBS 8507 TaxID=1296122 RepID=UPI00080D220F|nr:uncharacterized protein I203_06661 [Kwoniella mangroviensis CBS 8507]OCF64077.1 hypothetical protein I203_06661 [Kwoniella mangroviensis CBS 8507]